MRSDRREVGRYGHLVREGVPGRLRPDVDDVLE